MRLVELLARDLVEWPGTTASYTQDRGGECFPWLSGIPEFDGAEWFSGDTGEMDYETAAPVLIAKVATDYATAIVTREMWEAERAKLASTAEWNGEGLPPVGVVCEHQGDAEDYNSWFPVLILAHAKVDDMYVAVFQRTDDDIEISFSDAVFFRPIRTPEQIAAQEREEAITDLMQTTCIRRGEAARIYDAGYRKQEKSE